MKSLTIIRHAKTARPEGYDTDFARPLTPRGYKDAKRVAKVLARVTPRVDWLIASTARRVRETVAPIVDALETVEPIWEASAYLAPAATLLDLLKAVPTEMEHAVLVGHNPGMAVLVSGLSSGAAERLNVHMPTGTLAHFDLELFRWTQIRWGCGQLRFFLPPKILRK